MPFLQLTSIQSAGSHLSRPMGESSKIDPTLTENCFSQARHFQIIRVFRKVTSLLSQCGQVTPSGQRSEAMKLMATSLSAKNLTASSRVSSAFSVAMPMNIGDLVRCVNYIVALVRVYNFFDANVVTGELVVVSRPGSTWSLAALQIQSLPFWKGEGGPVESRSYWSKKQKCVSALVDFKWYSYLPLQELGTSVKLGEAFPLSQDSRFLSKRQCQ